MEQGARGGCLMYVHTIIPHLCSSWGPTTHCTACGVAMYHVLPPYAVLLRYSCAGDMILGSRSELKPCVYVGQRCEIDREQDPWGRGGLI